MIIDCEQPNLDQAKIIKYEEFPVFINDELILADTISVTTQNSLSPLYTLGKDTKTRIAANGPVETSININYYPSWNDIIYNQIKKFGKIKLKIGGIEIDNGYITNFSVNVSTNELTKSSASISFFDLPKGTINQLTIPSTRVFIKQESASSEPNLAHGNYSKLQQELVKIPLIFQLQYNAEISPMFKIGSSEADEIRFGRRLTSCEIQSEELSKFVTFNGGDDVQIKLTLFDACGGYPQQKQFLEYVKHYFTNDNIYEINGKVTRANIEGQSNTFIKGNLSVVQNI